MESHESPPAMVGTLPEEPGEPAFPLMDLDVEPVSENVRNVPVSSRLRSAQCSVRFNRFWDQYTRPNDDASCRSRHLPIKFTPWLHQGISTKPQPQRL